MNGTLENSLSIWRDTLGLPMILPSWIVACLGLIAIYVAVLLPSGAAMSYIERKLSADFQARVGPNRAGPAGIFQPVADLLKLLQKEPGRQWNWREAVWLAVHTMALYSTVAVIPLGSSAILVNTDMSAFLPFWAGLVLGLGTMLLGFSQGTVNGWFGGVRVAAQSLAGAFPALVAILCAGVHAGSFRWTDLAHVQSVSPLSWTATSNPFLFVAFIVFVVAGLVMLGIPPMDGGLSKQDIHGGVSSGLSGRRFTLFRFGRFYGFFLWSVIAVVMFLGGWDLPLGASPVGQECAELAWLLFRTFALMMIIIWVAKVIPRGRVDQITDFAWKVLSPFSLGALIGAGIWVSWRALL